MVGIWSPVWAVDAGQLPAPAPVMALRRYPALALPPSRFTQADVLVHGGERQPAPASPLPLLVMNVIGAPHPREVFPWNGQLPTPMGNTQPFTGGATGGFATAIADAEIGSAWNPSTRRNVVCTCEANWQRTALTTVPSSEGVKLLLSQTPSTMMPPGALPGFRSRLIRLPNGELCWGFS